VPAVIRLAAPRRYPEDEFEAILSDDTVKPTTAGILRARQPNQNKNPSAIWPRGRLLDFEGNGLLDTERM